MKTRMLFFMIVGLIILTLGVTGLSYSTRHQEAAQIFSATINRDCAPWDGAAFTVSVPMEDGSNIQISVWLSPAIKHQIKFSFPDETGRFGNAYILQRVDQFEQLSGEVSFQRVEERMPVEGEFNLTTEIGKQFEGRFKAEWGNQVVYCG